MKLRFMFITGLLVLSTQTWSESKWLSYGNGMINLDNVNHIQPGNIVHKEVFENSDNVLDKTVLDMYGVFINDSRCNNKYTWTYREWVESSKKDKKYLSLYSTIKINDEDVNLYSIEGHSDITLYDTFKNWYFFKNPLNENQINDIPETKLSISEQEKLLDSPDFYNKINEVMYSLLPVTKVEYENWLSTEEGNKIIEDTFNITGQYLSNTDPMYKTSIKFDDFELEISGSSCDLNLVSSVPESNQLIQDTLSKIGTFINSDKHYMELF